MTRFFRLLSAAGLALAAFALAPSHGPDGDLSPWSAALATGKTVQPPVVPSLRQRRQAARDADVRQADTQCRAVSREAAALKARPCAIGDRLDAASNVCHPRKNVWMPYVRWDPAAGRCKPRDVFDGASCVGTRQRYEPGRRHAQPLARSLGMYGNAPAQIEAKLDGCEQTATGLRHRASDARMKSARQCRQAKQLGRAELVQLYCK